MPQRGRNGGFGQVSFPMFHAGLRGLAIEAGLLSLMVSSIFERLSTLTNPLPDRQLSSLICIGMVACCDLQSSESDPQQPSLMRAAAMQQSDANEIED